jgi:hypothetical protein
MEESRRIRSLRPARPAVDPHRPHGWVLEQERTPAGALEPALTIFLSGAECPFTCVFCDLWRYTTPGTTPVGSLPVQLDQALGEALAPTGAPPPSALRLKLYNASNFFEERAVPVADEPRLLELLRPFGRVVVECHPKLVGERCLRFAAALGGRLEVAMGLETIHPRALPRLNKAMTLADFDAAAERLRATGLACRAFVLLGAPFVPPDEAVEWAVRSALHAWEHGVETVSVIPLRGGNGELERLRAAGEFTAPVLAQLEEALDRLLEPAAEAGGVATGDVWDLERFAACSVCFEARRARLERINLQGRREARVLCDACGGEG